MKKTTITVIFILIQIFVYGQKKIVNDIDFDHIKDTIYVDTIQSTIVCKLSTKKFKIISSKPIDMLNDQSGLRLTKNGFTMYNSWMRAGYTNEFKYNTKTKNIQLIGMSRYENGNVAGDGSGKSSVNLITSDYIGNWNYIDPEVDILLTIPTIKAKMKFKTIDLEGFSEEIYFDYAERCSELFHKYKQIKMNKK